MQRSRSPGTANPLTAHGHVTSQLQFSKYLPESCQLTESTSRSDRFMIKHRGAPYPPTRVERCSLLRHARSDMLARQTEGTSFELACSKTPDDLEERREVTGETALRGGGRRARIDRLRG